MPPNKLTERASPTIPLARRENATESCTRILAAAILDGVYPVGSRLPSEKGLAELLGVHRITARAACLRLTEAGLLRPVHGSGYWVQDYLVHGGPHLLSLLLRGALHKDLRMRILADLLRARRALLEDAVSLVAERSELEDRLNVCAIIARFESAVRDGEPPATLARIEGEALAEVLRATRSPVFQLLGNPVLQAYLGISEIQAIIYRDPALNAQGYAVFARWLTQQEVRGTGAFGSLMRSMLEQRDAETLALIAAQLDG